MTTIAIIDYEIGNIRSIHNAFKSQGATVILTNDHETILAADGVILPGVGSFKHGMNQLNSKGLIETIKLYVATGKPLLGICLGMQLLFTKSFEFGENFGLGLIEGTVDKLELKSLNETKLPHVNWNVIEKSDLNWDGTIFENIENCFDAYFVHTYAAKPVKSVEILSKTSYSNFIFCSAVKHKNVYGCQFHPEKSGVVGLQIINNFIEISRGK